MGVWSPPLGFTEPCTMSGGVREKVDIKYYWSVVIEISCYSCCRHMYDFLWRVLEDHGGNRQEYWNLGKWVDLYDFVKTIISKKV